MPVPGDTAVAKAALSVQPLPQALLLLAPLAPQSETATPTGGRSRSSNGVLHTGQGSMEQQRQLSQEQYYETAESTATNAGLTLHTGHILDTFQWTTCRCCCRCTLDIGLSLLVATLLFLVLLEQSLLLLLISMLLLLGSANCVRMGENAALCCILACSTVTSGVVGARERRWHRDCMAVPRGRSCRSPNTREVRFRRICAVLIAVRADATQAAGVAPFAACAPPVSAPLATLVAGSQRTVERSQTQHVPCTNGAVAAIAAAAALAALAAAAAGECDLAIADVCIISKN